MNMMAYWNMSYGVYVVSSLDENRAVGCVANSAMQVTINPERIAVSINKDNFTHSCIEKTGKFSLSVLTEDIDPKVIGVFGFSCSKSVDKFAEVPYEICESVPVLSDSCAYFVCKVVETLDCSTHTIFLGEVVDCDIPNDKKPMTYEYYHKVVKGRAPKTAPTYIPDELIPEDKSDNARYICSVCSYEYDGEIPFEDVPDDYECPICGQKKHVFEKR